MQTLIYLLCLSLPAAWLLGCASEAGSPMNEPGGATDAALPGSVADETALAAAPQDRPATVLDEPTKYHYVRDAQTGLIQSRTPLPQSWEVHSSESPVYISGPNGFKVYQSQAHQFGWSPDPFMQQSIRQMGQQVAPPASVHQILEQQVKPGAQAQGYRFVGTIEVPGIAGFWQRALNAMPHTGTRRSVEALGSEWETSNGSRVLILLIRTLFEGPQSITWRLVTTELESPAAHYEAAKSAYLYGIGSTELNPEWVAASNRNLIGSIAEIRRYWDNAAQISRNAHQQRMQAIEARGAAAQSVGKTYSDILDISHQGYLTRDNINSAGHSRTVNAIANTTVVGNHETGEHYTVDGNNAYYWMNNDGVYIGTDNALFDPRLHELTRNEEWTRFHKER